MQIYPLSEPYFSSTPYSTSVSQPFRVCGAPTNQVEKSYLIIKNNQTFFYVGTPSGVHLFDHLHTLHYTISTSSYMFHGDLLWVAFMYCIYVLHLSF